MGTILGRLQLHNIFLLDLQLVIQKHYSEIRLAGFEYSGLPVSSQEVLQFLVLDDSSVEDGTSVEMCNLLSTCESSSSSSSSGSSDDGKRIWAFR